MMREHSGPCHSPTSRKYNRLHTLPQIPRIHRLTYSTDDEVHTYISSNYFPNATTDEIDQLLKLYPADLAQGSPFDTGDANAVTPQFKRLAALQGDLYFIGPRRFFLQNRSSRQQAWSYRQ